MSFKLSKEILKNIASVRQWTIPLHFTGKNSSRKVHQQANIKFHCLLLLYPQVMLLQFCYLRLLLQSSESCTKVGPAESHTHPTQKNARFDRIDCYMQAKNYKHLTSGKRITSLDSNGATFYDHISRTSHVKVRHHGARMAGFVPNDGILVEA